jgi:hypothetical protein
LSATLGCRLFAERLLIEWRAGKFHCQESSSLICETVRVSCGVNVKAGTQALEETWMLALLS